MVNAEKKVNPQEYLDIVELPGSNGVCEFIDNVYQPSFRSCAKDKNLATWQIHFISTQEELMIIARAGANNNRGG